MLHWSLPWAREETVDPWVPPEGGGNLPLPGSCQAVAGLLQGSYLPTPEAWPCSSPAEEMVVVQSADAPSVLACSVMSCLDPLQSRVGTRQGYTPAPYHELMAGIQPRAITLSLCHAEKYLPMGPHNSLMLLIWRGSCSCLAEVYGQRVHCCPAAGAGLHVRSMVEVIVHVCDGRSLPREDRNTRQNTPTRPPGDCGQSAGGYQSSLCNCPPLN